VERAGNRYTRTEIRLERQDVDRAHSAARDPSRLAGARHDARFAVMADKRSQTWVSGLPPFGDARSSYVVIGTAWTALSRRDGQR
jgi:hypothetical protein